LHTLQVKGREKLGLLCTAELRIAIILERELNGQAVKNIAFDEKKFPMLF